VVCHLDLIKKFGWKSAESFGNIFESILSTIKNKDLAVEINTSGYNHAIQEAYPAQEIIKRCHEKEIRITLGSDAHRPADVGQHYDKALPMLIGAGYRHLATYTRRKRNLMTIVLQD
jgi:histidinol-phosphatase (PHP family)